MINGGRRRYARKSSTAAVYRKVFLSRVHQLLRLATTYVNLKAFTQYQETAITGEFVRVMDEIIDDPSSPRWVGHFSVHDDPPVNAKGRLGRSRKRLDIKVVSAQRLPRSRLSFEAKRLGKNYPVGEYLGVEGLGCFLSGDYAREEPDAGMLGYVQAETADVWAKRIADEIHAAASSLRLVAGDMWKHCQFKGGPVQTYHTRHDRPTVGKTVDIYHTLVMCCRGTSRSARACALDATAAVIAAGREWNGSRGETGRLIVNPSLKRWATRPVLDRQDAYPTWSAVGTLLFVEQRGEAADFGLEHFQ